MPSGAVYSGSWVEGRKHGPARYTQENGVSVEAEFQNDTMVSPQQKQLENPELACSWEDLGEWSDLALDQVKNTLLRNMGLLRRIYSFYSALGAQSSDNVFCMSRLQFHMFARDCSLNDGSLTGTEMDRVIAPANPEWGHSLHGGDDPLLMRHFLDALVRLAHFLHYKPGGDDFSFGECVNKLLAEDVFPRACALNTAIYAGDGGVLKVLSAVRNGLDAIYLGKAEGLDNSPITARRLLVRFFWCQLCQVCRAGEQTCVCSGFRTTDPSLSARCGGGYLMLQLLLRVANLLDLHLKTKVYCEVRMGCCRCWSHHIPELCCVPPDCRWPGAPGRGGWLLSTRCGIRPSGLLRDLGAMCPSAEAGANHSLASPGNSNGRTCRGERQ